MLGLSLALYPHLTLGLFTFFLYVPLYAGWQLPGYLTLGLFAFFSLYNPGHLPLFLLCSLLLLSSLFFSILDFSYLFSLSDIPTYASLTYLLAIKLLIKPIRCLRQAR